MQHPAHRGTRSASALLTALASLTATAAAIAGPGPAALLAPALAQGAAAQGESALSAEQARAAANRILTAEQRRDAQTRFSQFAPELQQVTSPAMIAESMARRPTIRGWTLLGVQSGIRTTTVEAVLDTSGGKQDLFIMLNGKGQLTGYYVDRTDTAPSKVANQFVQALSTGQYISARSFLAPRLQREISAAGLQARWQGLQRETGNFVKVNRVIEISTEGDQRLVLVNTTFNRLTDNLFVLLNANNLIYNVDFPNEPARLRGAR